MAHILVLDDVRDAAVMVQRILERQGHRVVVCTEEEEAVARIRDQRFDCAILDIKLKKLSGIDVLAMLKRIDPGLAVIMLTGYPTLETAREALRLGAAEYCVKPIDKEELETKVAQVLAGAGRPAANDLSPA